MATIYVVFMFLYQLQAILDYMISNMHETMLILWHLVHHPWHLGPESRNGKILLSDLKIILMKPKTFGYSLHRCLKGGFEVRGSSQQPHFLSVHSGERHGNSSELRTTDRHPQSVPFHLLLPLKYSEAVGQTGGCGIWESLATTFSLLENKLFLFYRTHSGDWPSMRQSWLGLVTKPKMKNSRKRKRGRK